jgi:TATA-box binding protein (TBP) (component of TFIID and TFIIIB)
MNCNGKALSLQEGKQRLRRYARILQKVGYSIYLKDIKLITLSACHTLSQPLNLDMLSSERDVNYEPELFSCLNFKREGINFGCFHTGKVIVTGVKFYEQIDDVVYPTLVEMELYTRKNE